MSGSHEWAVELDAFGKSYPAGCARSAVAAITGVSMRIRAGLVVGLLGPNGSGKSTTLRAIAGLVKPSCGAVRVFGAVAGSDAARQAVGFLPDALRWPPRQSGRELLHCCAGLAAVPSGKLRSRCAEVLDWAGLPDVADRPVETYSKGMRQRLGLAQAIVHEPRLVLLDEPASGLDPEGRLALVALIGDLRRQGRTVVFSSHLLAQAEHLCDRIVLLGGGRMLAEGTPDELLGMARSSLPPTSPLERFYLETLHA
jgi:ABC-type multidrug transport system ATPase subunit